MGVCLFGCAGARPAVDEEARAQMRVVLEHQQRIERRLDLLEARLDALARPAPRAEARRAASVQVPDSLATVRLSPDRRAPPVSTATSLREPSPQQLALLSDSGSREGRGGDEVQADFDSAIEAIRNGDVERGARALISFADRYPRHELAPRALFNAGAGLQNYGEIGEAALVLQRLTDDYPLAPDAPEAMVKLGECQRRLQREDAARASFARVIKRYPDSSAAKAAHERLESSPSPSPAQAN